jgi:hypothetical protein
VKELPVSVVVELSAIVSVKVESPPAVCVLVSTAVLVLSAQPGLLL